MGGLNSLFIHHCNIIIVALIVNNVSDIIYCLFTQATFVFNGTNLIASLLFLKLSIQWPCLMVTWEKLEKELSHRHRKISRITLATKFSIVTIVVMMIALGKCLIVILFIRLFIA